MALCKCLCTSCIHCCHRHSNGQLLLVLVTIPYAKSPVTIYAQYSGEVTDSYWPHDVISPLNVHASSSVGWKRIWLIGNKLLLNNKVKEVSFKIVHTIYLATNTLQRFGLDIEYFCTFCNLQEETIGHLFYECLYCRILWYDVECFIRKKTGQKVQLHGGQRHSYVVWMQILSFLCS